MNGEGEKEREGQEKAGSINILEKRGSKFNYSEERRYTLVTLCNGAECLFGVSSAVFFFLFFFFLFLRPVARARTRIHQALDLLSKRGDRRRTTPPWGVRGDYKQPVRGYELK